MGGDDGDEMITATQNGVLMAVAFIIVVLVVVAMVVRAGG